MNEDGDRPIRRRWLLAAILIAAVWAGVCLYVVFYRPYAERRYAARLADTVAHEPLSDAEFEWAMARLDHPFAQVAESASYAVAVASRSNPARLERFVAVATPLLDSSDVATRWRWLNRLSEFGEKQPPADPLRQRLAATAAGLLDDGNLMERVLVYRHLGRLGSADHLPLLRDRLAATSVAGERRQIVVAIDRLERAADR